MILAAALAGRITRAASAWRSALQGGTAPPWPVRQPSLLCWALEEGEQGGRGDSRSTQGKGSCKWSNTPMLDGEQSTWRLTSRLLAPKPSKAEMLPEEVETGAGGTVGGGGERGVARRH